tara:strand:- start:866 stop:1282 length:417 start_codon:yes stop_codon:yes gene_type:complete
MKYLYEPNKFEINAIISEIYNDSLDEDGFQVKTVHKKDLVEELLENYSDIDPDDPDKRIPSITVRTAYRWIRYNERDFGKNDPTSRECKVGKTTAKLIDEINNEMEQVIDDKGDLPSKIPRIKELTELLQKLKKLQKS